MKESLETIRSLELSGVFEDLYWGRDVPFDLDIYMSYPAQFRDTSLEDWHPLTSGGLVPVVDDGNFYNICFLDPDRNVFVVKFIGNPDVIISEYSSWQQYLANCLMEMADSGLGQRELIAIATKVGFDDLNALSSLLNELEQLADEVIEHRVNEFVRQFAKPE
jgi:hypothetical protein